MASKKNAITLTTDRLDEVLAELAIVDEKLAALKGTAAQWKKNGEAAALATLVSDFIPAGAWLNGPAIPVTFSITPGDTVADHIDTVRNYVLDCEQFANVLSTAWINANRQDGDESTALKVRRAELAVDAEAIISAFRLMGQADMVSSYVVPAAPKGTTGSTSARSGVKVSTMQQYRVVDGERVMPGGAGTQNKLSSQAWYMWQRPVEDVRAAMAAANSGHRVDETKDFETTLTMVNLKTNAEQTHTFGWYVIPQDDEPAADATPDEEEEAAEKALDDFAAEVTGK
jgi:hypothetical protein